MNMGNSNKCRWISERRQVISICEDYPSNKQEKNDVFNDYKYVAACQIGERKDESALLLLYDDAEC